MKKTVELLVKNFLCLCIAGWMLSSTAMAADKNDKMIVGWSPDVYMVDTSVNDGELVDERARLLIQENISSKLHSLRQDNKLPFLLKEVNQQYNTDQTMPGELGIIVLVVDNNSLDIKYRTRNAEYYKSIVLCGMDIMLCSVEEETKNMRILQTIPLRGYKVLGNDVNHPIVQPLTLEQKQEAFAETAKSLIKEDLEFSSFRGALKNALEKKLLPETYQVTEVKISSPKAAALFENNAEALKALIGGIFTSKYQQKTDRIVYPSMAGREWKKDAVSNLYSLQMQSPGGSLTICAPEAMHKISLEVTGIAAAVIPSKKPSTVKYDVGYKAWLKKEPVEKNEKAEVSKVMIEQYPIKEGRQPDKEPAIQPDLQDIYIELFGAVAADLAAQADKGN